AGLDLEIAGALHNVAVALADRERIDEAATLATAAQAGFAALGDRHGVARVGLTRGDLAYRRGELTAARAQLDEALELAREAAAPVSIALIRRKLAEVAWARGDLDGALSDCGESLALGLESGMVAVVAEALEIAARVARRRDR